MQNEKRAIVVSWAERIRNLRGLRAALTLVSCGAVAALALPPIYLLPALAVIIPVLIWRIDGARSVRRAMADGFLFGLGHFLIMIYWVGNAFLVDADTFGWVAPIAVAGLAAVLAVIPAIVFGTAKLLWRPGWSRIFIFAGLWTLGELLREVYLTGFPWAPIGMTWMWAEPIIQSVALFGVTGLGLLTVLVFGLFAVFGDRVTGKARGLASTTALTIVLLLTVGGGVRLWVSGGYEAGWDADTHWRLESGERRALLRARLVQPAIPQSMKWASAEMAANVRRHLDLSASPGLAGVDVVIWGETAVPYSLNAAPNIRAVLARVVPKDGFLITGSVRRALSGRENAIWNSLFVLDGSGDIRATYDKSHLVPFGEYIPIRWIPGLKKVTEGLGDFSAGPGPTSIDLHDLPSFSPLICYEVIFPGRVVPDDDARPAWIVNVTNDGWYGRSTGPYQHLQITRLRAIEEGLPLVRVASTGISGVVSPLGRLSPVLALEEPGYLDVDVPPPLNRATIFARFGNWIPLGMAFVCIGMGLILGRNPRRER